MILECLSSEDCENSEYCNTVTNICEAACSLKSKLKCYDISSLKIVYNLCYRLTSIKLIYHCFIVCGQDSLCKGKLHRPLCYCPSGYEGNPHEICTKVVIISCIPHIPIHLDIKSIDSIAKMFNNLIFLISRQNQEPVNVLENEDTYAIKMNQQYRRS